MYMIYLSFLFLASLFLGTTTSTDVNKEKSPSNILVVIEGHSTTVKCASFFANYRQDVNGTFYFKWTAPSNVRLQESMSVIEYDHSNVSLALKIRDNAVKDIATSRAKSFVESTAGGSLILHLPSTSFAGQYVCRSISHHTGETIRIHSVTIRVIKESHVDTEYRTKIGVACGAVGLFLVVAVLCGWRYHQRKKTREYVKAKTDEMVKLRIPTIMILDVDGQKVEEDSFEYTY